jgi:hypothetical protein
LLIIQSSGALELSGLPAFFDQSRYTTQRGTTHNGQWQWQYQKQQNISMTHELKLKLIKKK